MGDVQVGPVPGQVLGDQAAVAAVGGRLAAQQHGGTLEGRAVALLDRLRAQLVLEGGGDDDTPLETLMRAAKASQSIRPDR
jgi:hypothetical protein